MSDLLAGLGSLFGGTQSFQSAFTDLGGAVSDLFGAQGDKIEAKNYSDAANLEEENANIAVSETAIKESQAQRQIAMGMGAENAETGGAGFVAGKGSGADLLRMSAQQGALTTNLVREQGFIEEQGYKAQAGAYLGAEQAAQMAAKAGQGGGLLKGLGAIMSIF